MVIIDLFIQSTPLYYVNLTSWLGALLPYWHWFH